MVQSIKLILISLMALVLFSGCVTTQEYEFCKSVMESKSNVTGLYDIHENGDFMGCSDGQSIYWFDRNFYFESEITMEEDN